MSQKRLVTLSVCALLLTAATGVRASGPVATHPAMPAGFVGTTMDTDKFLVQPPASVRWTVPRANFDHPAVITSRQAAKVDANTFLVQPPASTHWELRDDRDRLVPVVAVAR